MHERLGDLRVLAFDVHVTAVLAGVLIAGATVPAPALFGARHYAAFAAGFVVATGAIATVVLVRGTTPARLMDGVVWTPLRVGTRFGTTPDWFLSWWPLPVAFDGLALLRLARARFRPAARPRGVVLWAISRAGYAALLLAWVTWLRLEVFDVLLAYGLPVVLLVLLGGPREEQLPGKAFARRLLGFLAVTASLWLYPVAGSQRAFASFLTALALVVVLIDACRDGVAALSLTARPWGRRAVRAVPAGAIAVLLFIYLAEAIIAVRMYRHRVPLDLPGTRWIRIDRVSCLRDRRIVEALLDEPDTFFTMPGMASFYFWTRRAPPTRLNLTNWMYILDDRQQERIVAELAVRPDVCVVVNHYLIRHWMEGRPLPDTPLTRYIRDNFVTVQRIGGDELRVRRERLDPAQPLP
jgi:hypothetical protein